MVLALIFAELLAGGVLVVSAYTGHSTREVIKGENEPVEKLLGGRGKSGKPGESSLEKGLKASEGLEKLLKLIPGLSVANKQPETKQTEKAKVVEV